MTYAQLDLNAETGTGTLTVRIDLLRTMGSDLAYLDLARNIDAAENQRIWSQMIGAIDLSQDGQRLSLSFISAAPPDPLIPEAFTDPFTWPRMTLQFRVSGYAAALPLKATFTPGFIFEEPIALSIKEGNTRMSRWLITSQASPLFISETVHKIGVVDASEGRAPITSSLLASELTSTLMTGFAHILPLGIDHLMFVLAMLLLCTSLRQTIMLVTGFTLGHSLSLALAGLKWIEVPAAWVEPLILLSISFYAVQALRKNSSTLTHGFWLVSTIGLVHGLGFAAAFIQLEWASSPTLHLLAFNLGIEIAQILFVVLLYPVITRYRQVLIQPIAWVLILAPLVVLIVNYV